jgi:hypothetical protein
VPGTGTGISTISPTLAHYNPYPKMGFRIHFPDFDWHETTHSSSLIPESQDVRNLGKAQILGKKL